MAKTFLTPEALAERWNLPLSTLNQWRWHGKGPQFGKMGKRVRYALEDIEQFEDQFVRRNTCYEKNNLYSKIKAKK
ncbi:MAG: hypothetical protein BGO67_08560 [Alphaproteobacteria bacterium 41-28]|nr:MAG: hypothetical protein BGO67_08560 [Alphaproteobacteria bacterium 41-28]